MKHIILFIFSVILLGSCKNSDFVSVNRELVGKWNLDSVSIPSGIITNSKSESKTFDFKNETDYTYESSYYDMDSKLTGKYFIVENPKRGLKTLSFVPDLDISGKDTIRQEYSNFDIICIDPNRLVLIDNTVIIEGEPHVRFNKIFIFKKIK